MHYKNNPTEKSPHTSKKFHTMSAPRLSIIITLTACLLSLTCFYTTAARSVTRSDAPQLHKVHQESSSTLSVERNEPVKPRDGSVVRSLMKGRTKPSAPSHKGHSAPSFRRHLLRLNWVRV
ncbi:hypothetical protein QQ045_002067 [Rhodiola kirilowii]